MIAVLEPFCVGLEHVPVNSAIIEVIGRAFPDERLNVFAEPGHLLELQGAVGSGCADRISWQAVEVPPRHAPFAARLLPEAQLLRRACAARDSAAALCVMLSVHRSTLWAAKAVVTGRLVRAPMQAVLHGAVSEVAGWRSRNPFVRMWDMRSTLVRCADRKIQYVVLEEPICLALTRRIPSLEPHLTWLPHPVPAAESWDAVDKEAHSPVRIAFVGLASAAKGFPEFLRVSARVSSSSPNRAEFHALGALPLGAPAETCSALATQPARAQLERTEFLARLRSMHYVCLPYQAPHYELVASGALLDAIAQAKPIIALATPALQHLFDLHPTIGYLCASEEEMAAVVERVVKQFPPAEYQRQVEGLKALRSSRLPDALASHYFGSTQALLGVAR